MYNVHAINVINFKSETLCCEMIVCAKLSNNIFRQSENKHFRSEAERDIAIQRKKHATHIFADSINFIEL